ncbi:MAG: carboxypeptidase regulatory-like domain-containing protein [Acidobacteria bacterium]|nr:carboxypeptidase regulatory-like domain-containing protein [Acidobacteriota bacterium]
MSRAWVISLLAVCAPAVFGQETRGMIYGRVLDPSSAPVAGASVVVENADTNTATRLTTNQTGYYEANLLLPGDYRVSAEFTGFKRIVRGGITLPLSTRLEINLTLELGALAETVSVTAQAPLLDTATASSGRVVDNRSVMDLPVIANNTMVLVKLTAGVQTSGVNDYLGPHSNSGASDYSIGGNVGGNEWSIDGVPNNGAGRKSAYLPVADTVQEMKVETSSFDASIGHTSGVNVTMMTKAGTNQFHGTLTEQHWQQRWHGAPFFTKQLYYNNIAAAQAAGNTALANDLSSQDKQMSGRSNNYAGSVGGPVRLPKLFNGKDRLFFFFSYQGNKDSVADLPSRYNNTIPTLDDRKGDFSRFLGVNAGLYQIYDPLSVRPDPARATHYVRDPIPGNLLPQSRMVNPAYNWYLKVLPAPNNDNDPKREPLNNYLSVDAPLVRDYKAYSNRADFNLSDRHRFFARWSYNDWINEAADWTYHTMKGLQSLRQSRTNLGGTADWVYTLSSSTVLDVAVAANNYREGSRPDVAMSFKPSDVGLPAYMDQRAGAQTILPVMNFSGYRSVSVTYPSFTHFRTLTGKADISHIRGDHTLRAGFDTRGQFRTGGGGGNTSGTFNFTNTYTRRNDDTFTPAGNLAHSWAAFSMGLPDSMSVATTDSYATFNPYYGWYAQDNWRLTQKLTLNLGLRLEYELGPTERFNRILTYFDPNAKLPITDLAQAAYTARPVPEQGAAGFLVKGGSVYAGSAASGRRMWQNEFLWLPRLAAAYQLDSKTVIRGGYGLFYDTLNVLNDGPDQTGYSRTTSTTLTTDFGVNWLAGDPRRGVSPLTDPFPVRANGTRFDEPTRDGLGLMARAGRGWTFDPYGMKHARQQRWRIGVQRQIGQNMLLDVAYAGSFSDRVPIQQTLSPLAGQYWAKGLVRDNNVANNLNSNVSNPFLLSNFASLRTSDPLLYQDLSTLGFFTSSTIRKNQLLRAFPQMNGVSTSSAPLSAVRSHALEIQFQRRFAQGFNLSASYTKLKVRTSDFFMNEFDSSPTWRQSNDGRPHRFIATGIYEFPFGKGRHFLKSGVFSYLVGGFQAAASFEYQPGPLLDWGNVFFYGNLTDINTGIRTLDRWFNTGNFERVSSRGPAAFHERVFPTRIEGLRADMTNQWNVNLQREFRFAERARFQIRVDALNLQNRTQFAGPNTNPASTDFGRVTSQTNTRNRFLQLQGRISF